MNQLPTNNSIGIAMDLRFQININLTVSGLCCHSSHNYIQSKSIFLKTHGIIVTFAFLLKCFGCLFSNGIAITMSTRRWTPPLPSFSFQSNFDIWYIWFNTSNFNSIFQGFLHLYRVGCDGGSSPAEWEILPMLWGRSTFYRTGGIWSYFVEPKLRCELSLHIILFFTCWAEKMCLSWESTPLGKEKIAFNVIHHLHQVLPRAAPPHRPL